LLHRIWQLLLKGHEEVVRAVDPNEAADMAVLRVIHASQVPDPGELARRLESGAPLAISTPAASSTASPASPAAGPVSRAPADFVALIELLYTGGKMHMAQQLHDSAGLVSYAAGDLAIRPVKPLPGEFTRDLAAALKALTDIAWDVRISDATAQPSLLQQDQAREAEAKARILATPIVKATLEAFPEAELIDYVDGTEPRTEQRSIAQ
jgi:DNA polymerase-3 subunit gamma/tau